MEHHVTAFIGQLGKATPHTRRTYGNDLKHFGRWYAERYGQPVALEAITPMVVVLYKATLVDKLRLKPATVKRRLVTLHRFCRWAAAEGLIQEVPTRNVKIPPAPRGKPDRLPRADVERILLAARQDRHKLARRNYAILRLLADVGLRVGVLVALRVGDVAWTEDQRAVTLSVPAAGKTRSIPLPHATAAVLLDYLTHRRPVVAADPLFVSTHGAALHTETVRHLVNKYAAQVGLNPREISPRRLKNARPEA